jgi:hypothetical protein
MDEISSRGAEALHDHWIWTRDVDVNPSIPSDFMGPRIGYIRRIGGESPKSRS